MEIHLIRKEVLFRATNLMTLFMKRYILLAFFIGFCFYGFSQSKKEVKKHKIKASAVSVIENGKTINESKIIFDSNGNEVEVTDYNKEGVIKAIHKTKYNSEGDEIEDLQYDANNKLIEKKIIKYNSFGEKSEEQFYDATDKPTKKNVYTYDNKGLKTEKKTVDADGKVISIKKHIYITK
jgi:hypothetical protein